jgi:hypothetical protein
MSDSPLLSKMDALMKKHRGGGIAEPEPVPRREPPPPGAWLPVLTDVIKRGTPFAVAPVDEHALEAVTPAPARESDTSAAATKGGAPEPATDDALAEHLLGELAPRLSKAMKQQVAAEMRKNLDLTVANLLSQLDVDVREIVREAVAEKLKKPHDPSA